MDLYVSALLLAICFAVISTWNGALCQETSPEVEEWDKSKYMEEAGQTFKLIFHKYEPGVRPPERLSEITLALTLTHIHHLDLAAQELQTVLDVKVMWNDTRLQWYPKRLHSIVVNDGQIWIPDIVYTNIVKPSQNLYPSSLKVSSKGQVVWAKKELVTTYCRTDPSSARQYCSIDLAFLSEIEDRVFSNTSTLTLPEDFTNLDWKLEMAEITMGGDENTTDHFTMSLDLALEARGDDPRRSSGSERTTGLSSASSSSSSSSSSSAGGGQDPGCCQTEGLEGINNSSSDNNDNGNAASKPQSTLLWSSVLVAFVVAMVTDAMSGRQSLLR